MIEAPEGTVGTAVQSYKLDAAVVDGGEWSIFLRADFTLGELVTLRRWDVRKVGMVGLASPQCAEEVRGRFLERLRCRFQIPADVRCDRTFLEEARDGLYVKAMHTWLFEEVNVCRCWGVTRCATWWLVNVGNARGRCHRRCSWVRAVSSRFRTTRASVAWTPMRRTYGSAGSSRSVQRWWCHSKIFRWYRPWSLVSFLR